VATGDSIYHPSIAFSGNAGQRNVTLERSLALYVHELGHGIDAEKRLSQRICLF
jgi:hypothetical protein